MQGVINMAILQNLTIRRGYFCGLAIAASFFLLAAITACSDTPLDDHGILQQHLKMLVSAVEQEDSGAIMAFLHQDVLANQQLRKANIRGLLLLNFRRYADIALAVSNEVITVEQDKAKITFSARLTSGKAGVLKRGRQFQVETYWRRHTDGWLIHRIQWQEIA